MSREIDIINDLGTPITENTFKKYDWERVDETDDSDMGDSYHFWVLPLPIDNPDENAPTLISCASDEWEMLGIPEGTYIIEIEDMNGLGYCQFEEEVEILYQALTGKKLPLNKKTDTEDE
jgi:hypothetical protein